jgi:peptide chain release factor 2
MESIEEMLNEECSEEILAFLSSEIEKLAKKVDSIYVSLLFAEEDDESNCFISINSGSGGLEAEDWAKMICEMYKKYITNTGYAFTTLDESFGDEGGIKSCTIKVMEKEKTHPYGWLKSESGVHRLVRISPFDKDKQRHTSFSSVLVTPELNSNINIEINEKDIKIDTYKASGAGGQHVNKTESAIRITHIPTGIVTQCQSDRSQHRNKDEALKMLKSKLYEHEMRKNKAIQEEKAGDKKEISWGSQIRSYVAHPYQMVKDHRTNHEIPNFDKVVVEGNIEPFLSSYLKSKV